FHITPLSLHDALPISLDHPDFWVRPRAGGPSGWWCSNVTPMPPRERPGRLTYKCATCGSTHRLVDTVENAPKSTSREQPPATTRSEEHTSELQSQSNL